MIFAISVFDFHDCHCLLEFPQCLQGGVAVNHPEFAVFRLHDVNRFSFVSFSGLGFHHQLTGAFHPFRVRSIPCHDIRKWNSQTVRGIHKKRRICGNVDCHKMAQDRHRFLFGGLRQHMFIQNKAGKASGKNDVIISRYGNGDNLFLALPGFGGCRGNHRFPYPDRL